jgi:hypothetical protein
LELRTWFGLRTAAPLACDGSGINASAQNTFPAAVRMQPLAADRRGKRGFPRLSVPAFLADAPAAGRRSAQPPAQ